MEKMIGITLTGSIGAGKSAVARQLCDRFGYTIHSSGGVFRSLAREAGVSVVEYQGVAAGDPSIDKAIDEATSDVPAWAGVCFDSRVGFAFAREPHFRVLLTCPEELAAQRVLAAGRADEQYADIESAKRSIAERQDAERFRYSRLYGIPDYLDPDLHDCVVPIVSGMMTPESIADAIMRKAEGYSMDLEPGRTIIEKPRD